VVVAGAEVPSGLARVAPCETVAGGAAVEDDAGGSPSGFEIVAPCVAEGVVLALLPAVDGVVCPGGLAALAAGVLSADALTVADRTLAVMLGEPAELGVEVTGAGVDAGATAGVEVFVAAVAGAAGLSETTLGFSAPAASAAIFGPAFGAGATLTLVVAGALVTGALDVGTVSTANSGLGGLGTAVAV
jgi:hypothetical protein